MFLNGGPGSPGFLYVAQRHQHAGNVIPGWMGHADRFAFEASYRPAQARALPDWHPKRNCPGRCWRGAVGPRWHRHRPPCGMQPPLSDAFLAALGDHPTTAGIECPTPHPTVTGVQISLRLPEGYPISQALIERGVIVDFREPDIVRFGFAPCTTNRPTLIRRLLPLRTS